jgi:hypothetical protein
MSSEASQIATLGASWVIWNDLFTCDWVMMFFMSIKVVDEYGDRVSFPG